MEHREYAWLECRACARRYQPEDWHETEWSQVADVLAGIGGMWWMCPNEHVIFTLKTWVA